MSAVAQQHDRLGGDSLQDCVVFSRVTRVACARYVSDDRAKANSLTALADGGSVEGSKSDQAILVGGGWADLSAANTELENNGSVVLLGNSSFCGGKSTTVATDETKWSEHEDTAPEVNQRLWRFVHVCHSEGWQEET